MNYFPQNAPADVKDLPQFIANELQSIAAALAQANQTLLLAKSNSAPAKPREGMIALADGINWNPGRGVGYYGYQSGAWSFLSYSAPVDITPAGIVAYFASSTAPAGYLKANGALVSRAAYAALFSAIGTTYGAGDGSTTFALPDLRGEFIRSFDDGRAVDSGRVIGSAQTQDVQPHLHSIRTSNAGFTGGNPAVQYAPGDNNGTTLVPGGGITYGIQNNSGTETRPRNVALLACIKY